MASRAEYFRVQAKKCEDKAGKAREVEAKRMFLEAAEEWRKSAEMEERRLLGLTSPDTSQE